MPATEKDKDNVGVLALLPGEEPSALNASNYFHNILPQDVSATQETFKEIIGYSFASTARQLPRIKSGGAHFSRTAGYPWVNGRERVRSRSLIVLSPDVFDFSDNLFGSLVGHEFDHADFLLVNVQAQPELYEAGNQLRHAAAAEKSAYLLGYSLLAHSGELEGWPTPDDIVETHQSGGRIASLYSQED